MTNLLAKIFGKFEVTEETKNRVVANIQKANSHEYQHQVASHALVTKVIDDMLADPYWRETMIECTENVKKQGVK